MAKKFLKRNVRIEIPYCEDAIRQIIRYGKGICEVTVKWDIHEFCEFCGLKWEVNKKDIKDRDLPIGIPMCCDKAQEEWRLEKKKVRN